MDGFQEQEQVRENPERQRDGGQDNAPAEPQAMQPMNDPAEATRRAKQAEIGIVAQQLAEKAARQAAEETEGVKITKKAAEKAEKAAKKAEKKATKAIEAVTKASIRNADAAKEAQEAREAADAARGEAEEAARRAEAARQGGNAEEAKEAEEAARRAEEAVERAEEAANRAEEAAEAARLKKEGKEGEAREAIEEAARTASASEGAQDEFNAVLMQAVLEAGGMEAGPEGGEADNRKFDTLAELKNLDQGEPQEGDEENLKKAREDVHKLRKGNLYKAVIIARILDHTTNPEGYDAEQALKDQKEAAGSREKSPSLARFERFIDAAAKGGKTAAAINGIAGTVNKGYGKSKMSSIISIISDVTMLANSVRGIVKKIAGYRKLTGTSDKIFAIISLVSDFSMAVAKLASITKSFGEIFNMPENLKRAFRIVSSANTLLSQTTGLAGTCRTLKKTSDKKKELEKTQGEERVRVIEIVNSVYPENGNEEAPENNDEEAPENNNEEAPENNNEAAPVDEGSLTKKVIEVLDNPDIRLTEDQKATLVSYLARGKVIANKDIALLNTAYGLITTVLGMGSVITKEIAKENDTNQAAAESADFFGMATNVSTLGSMAGSAVTAIGNKVVKKDDGTRLVKDQLWNALTNLGKDENRYGLRGIANDLNREPNEQRIGDANAAVEQYGKVKNQLDAADADYSKLFEAKNEDEFKNALVAGL